MRKLLFLSFLGLCLGAFLEQPALANDPPLWKIVGDKTNKDWNVMRINTRTGQSWIESDNHWTPIPETGAAPPPGDAGEYDCVVYFPAESESFYSLRWNVRSGQSWALQSGKWVGIVVDDK
jgi:hypothetical protein